MAMVSKAEAKAAARNYKETLGDDTMSKRAYVFAMMSYIVVGLAGAAHVASLTYAMKPETIWIAYYFGLVIPGLIIALVTSNPIVTTIGYALMILPSGAIVGPFVSLFTWASVVDVMFYTLAITLVVGFLGAIWPHSLENWYGFLLGSLLVIIAAEWGQLALWAWFGVKPFLHQGTIDWFAILVFTGLIFVDMNQAMAMPKNLNNAILNAINMYWNILNLFVRLLARSGKLAVDNAGAVGEVVASAAEVVGDAA